MNRRVATPVLTYNVWAVSVFLMLFWGFHYSVFEVLHITPVMVLCVELFAVCSVVVLTAKNAVQNITLMFGWVIFYLIILRNNYYIEKVYLTQPVATFLVIVLAYCLQFSDQWYRALRQCITIFSIEHFVFAWFFFFAKDFYANVIIPRFPQERLVMLKEYQAQNILIGFTNHFSISGIFFGFGCITAFIYWLQKKKSFWRILSVFLMLASLIMTQKRGPLAFSLCAIVVIFLASEKISFRSFLIFVGSLAAAVALYFAVESVYPPIGAVFDKFINVGDSGRGKLQAVALELFKQAPVFGVGFGQYREYSLNYYSVEYGAHNIYLQLLAEIGIVGVTFFVIMLLLMLGLTIWSVRHTDADSDKEKKFALLFSLGCQVYFVLYGLTGNPIYDPQCYLPYFISIAVPLSIHLNKRIARKRGHELQAGELI